MKKQVTKEHYENYDTPERFISYYFQIENVLALKPSNVLEIGIANKVVSNYLQSKGIKVTTCDIDDELKPDVIADIRKLPFKDKEFDLVIACEVLEHIPFADFKEALKEIRRVSDKHAVISIPYATFSIYGYIKPFIGLKPRTFFIKLIERFFQEHHFDGQHYWEMGKKDHSRKKTRENIISSGWRIIKEFAQPFDPYHYFFILKKEA